MKITPRPTQSTYQIFSLTLLLTLSCLVNIACEKKQQDYFQGYVEGEYLHISSPIGGRLEKLSVARGMAVTRNQQLFILDQTLETASVAEAEQGLLHVENQLADISKGLRSSEIEAIKAKREQAKAAYNLAQMEFDRREKLLQQKVIAKEMLDRTRTEMERTAAAVAQLDAELETAQLGARSDEVKAAQAEVEAAKERLVQARWKLDQKTQIAPQEGLVFDTFYEQGEYVPGAHPVLSLLPPGNVKIRFFVPEPLVGTIKSGQNLSIHFDGSQKSYQAKISFISPQPEYTPPVIYSRKTRTHLVFMVEAKVSASDGAQLHPGQPVDVYLESPNV
jgi:HlyD family secretion protein